jgi:DNA-binding LacI/PurR family transcriptional regulator
MGKTSRLPTIYLVLVFVILYAPIFYLVYYSFNSGGNMFAFESFTLEWYQEVFQDTRLLIILLNTVTIALLSAAISTIIGVAGALALTNIRRRRLRIEALGGAPPDDNLIRYGEPGRLDAIIHSYLGLRHPPTAIYATSDSLALATHKSLTKMGMRIPEDMALVGMDNDDWTSALTPSLSVLEQPVAEMARVATQNLLRRLDGVDCGEPWQLVLTPRLLIRESSEETLANRKE